jgi:hypothetical protein
VSAVGILVLQGEEDVKSIISHVTDAIAARITTSKLGNPATGFAERADLCPSATEGTRRNMSP